MNRQWLEFMLAIAVLLLPMVVAWFIVTQADRRKRSQQTPRSHERLRHGKLH